MGQLTSINPSDGTVVWTGPETHTSSIPGMASSSRKAFHDWSLRPLAERETIARNFAGLLGSRSEDMATMISREIGKPLWESRTEVAAMIGKVDISIRAQRERCGEFSGGKAVTRFRPHGVIAVIGPYNFPGHLPNGHICPALLAGNSVLFKPSEIAPATAQLLAGYWHEAGVPEDVLQVVVGGAEVARELTAQPELNGVFFTGSAATGKRIASQFADSPGRILALEMGGNNPLIVDPANIADLEAAAKITLNSAFISAGQRCTCARRLVLIESDRASDFLARLIRLTRAIIIDDPFATPEPFIGPLASPAFPSRVCRQQAGLLASGAVPILASQALKDGTGFLSPGILDVTGVENLPDEEIFGPVLQIIRVKDLDAAIAVANNTRYGLASGILTDLRSHYEYAGPRLRAGIINWNTQLTGASSAAPFGGLNDSGNNRPSAFFAADYCSYPVASIEVPRCE